MLIEAARRFEAAAKEMLVAMNEPSVSCDEARQVLAVCKSAAAALTATQTSAAAIVAGVERHGDGGVQVLADAAGLSRRDAVGRVKTAKAVGASPTVRDAVESGRVSQANAKRLAEAIEKTSAEAVESDTELLSKAASMRPEQFTREARKWAADRQGDGGEGDYRRLRARRRVRVWDSDDDGMVHIHGQFDPVAGNRIGNRLRAVAGRLHDLDKAQASDKSERRSFDQCMADALDSLTADNLAGHRSCADNAGAVRGSRNPSSVESGCGWRLLARYGGCFHCAAHPALCQIHHIRPVSQGGSTRLDNMVPVCWDCHQKIHHHKWRIRTTNGEHTLHPPGRAHYGPAHAPEEPTLHLPGIATDGLLAGAVRAGG